MPWADLKCCFLSNQLTILSSTALQWLLYSDLNAAYAVLYLRFRSALDSAVVS